MPSPPRRARPFTILAALASLLVACGPSSPSSSFPEVAAGDAAPDLVEVHASPTSRNAAPTPPPELLPPNRDLPGDIGLSIHRDITGPDDAALIARAEALCPPRAEVLAARRPAHDPEPPRDQCLWWYTRFDGIPVVYAITREAVDHYAARIAEFRGGNYRATAGIVITKARLSYRATVSHQRRFEHKGQVFDDVDVVEMRLEWHQYCGGECAMGFGASRWVVFPRSGEPQMVGNEATPFIVS